VLDIAVHYNEKLFKRNGRIKRKAETVTKVVVLLEDNFCLSGPS